MLKPFDPHPTDPEVNARIAKMPNVRVFYSKTGPAKYISHLDITRCMQRSLKRAGIPVWYTQGFNPHMYMTFALPLSLGYESVCEAMDLRLTELMDFTEMKTRLNASLPRDLQVLSIDFQQQKPQEIAFADYELRFLTADGVDFCRALQAFASQTEILVEKKTKKGLKEIDIKPEMQILQLESAETGAFCRMRTTAGQRNMNPTLLTDVFLNQYHQAVGVAVLRTALLTADGTPFR